MVSFTALLVPVVLIGSALAAFNATCNDIKGTISPAATRECCAKSLSATSPKHYFKEPQCIEIATQADVNAFICCCTALGFPSGVYNATKV